MNHKFLPLLFIIALGCANQNDIERDLNSSTQETEMQLAEIDSSHYYLIAQVGNWIVEGSIDSVIDFAAVNPNIDILSLREHCLSYHVRFHDQDLYSHVSSSQKVGSDGEFYVSSYSSIWKSSQDTIAFHVEAELMNKDNQIYPESITLISYEDDLKSLKFPGGELKEEEVVPSIAPPAP